MGWLFMSRGGMAPFATPKAYLDNQCTYPPDPEKGRESERSFRVVQSGRKTILRRVSDGVGVKISKLMSRAWTIVPPPVAPSTS